jgi:cytochrome c551/c552
VIGSEVKASQTVIGALILSWGATQAEYAVKFLPPATQEQARIATHMRQSGTLENFTTLINRAIVTPHEVPVIARACGVANAFYSPDRREITLCYELLVSSEKSLRRIMGNRYNDAQYTQVLYSEVAFVLLHEMGHHLIHEYSVPVLGREEDAADKIASYIFLTSGGEKVLKRSLMFFATNPTNLMGLVLNGSTQYGDEHGLNEQRLANLVCWGLGKDSNEFGPLAAFVKLPQSRLVRCRDEYEKMVRDNPSLLGTKVVTSNIPSRASQLSTGGVALAEAPTSAKANQCTACHAADRRMVGPSFKEMAGRYSTDELTTVLVKKVRQGSAGVWGAVPAPAMTGVDSQSASQLASWIAT